MIAAIVSALLFVPAGALLAGFCLLVGVALPVLVTFGGTLHPVLGLLAWWALGFLPALAYVAYVLPWSRRES